MNEIFVKGFGEIEQNRFATLNPDLEGGNIKNHDRKIIEGPGKKLVGIWNATHFSPGKKQREAFASLCPKTWNCRWIISATAIRFEEANLPEKALLSQTASGSGSL